MSSYLFPDMEGNNKQHCTYWDCSVPASWTSTEPIGPTTLRWAFGLNHRAKLYNDTDLMDHLV